MDSIEIKKILDQLKGMASAMASMPEDHRIVAYKSVDALFLKLERHLRDHADGRAAAILDEIKTKVILMARLDDPTEDSDEAHLQQAHSLVDDLRAILCRQ
jgi:hypothetical protein